MGLLAAGIVDHDIEAAEFFDRISNELLAKIGIPQIPRQCDAVAPGILDQLDHFLRVRLFVRVVVDGNVGTFARIGDGGGAAHTAVTTRDQAFASVYDSMQVSAHKDAVSLFERYAKGGDDDKLKDWAGKTLPALQHHLEMAQQLDQKRKE